MDDDGGLGFRNWGFYEAPVKGHLGLQLMSSASQECDTKLPLSNGSNFIPRREHGLRTESPMPFDFVRDGWAQRHPHHHQSALQPIQISNHQRQNHLHHQSHIFGMMDDAHALQMMQQQQHHHELPPEPLEDQRIAMIEEPLAVGRNETPLKKRPQGRPPKSPKSKAKKPKKSPTQKKEDGSNGSASSRMRGGNRSMGVMINGIDLDLSSIPTPVCSCTGTPQQCYRWGVGGWQSACCTNSISEYPLPMSSKRRGARISGRKMSHGAFKKVLEKLAGEGYNLANPIDLKSYWAKHGTNKFVVIR